MNRYEWNNPPPPGTEVESDDVPGVSKTSNIDEGALEHQKALVDKNKTSSRTPKRRHRSRSHSHHSRSHSHRSRSQSRERRRRSRSRSRRKRRNYSSSRSRSRSPGYRRKHSRHARRHSRSRSRSRGSRRRVHRSRSRSYRSRTAPKSEYVNEHKVTYSNKDLDGDVLEEEDMRLDDEDDGQSDSEQAAVPFKNDGSFLEMFKKMQEEQKAKDEPSSEELGKKPVLPSFGKRRGGKVLKTGLVAKVKNVEEEQNKGQDAWSVYMQEVRKYKEVHCDDDSKTRPLVK